MQGHGQYHAGFPEAFDIPDQDAKLLAKEYTCLCFSFVFQMVNEFLYQVSFAEEEAGSGSLEVDPAPEYPGHRIIYLFFKMGFWQVMKAGQADDLFGTIEALPASKAYPWIEQGQQIRNDAHVFFVYLIDETHTLKRKCLVFFLSPCYLRDREY